MNSNQQGKRQNVWHPVKDHQACKEENIISPEQNNHPVETDSEPV